MDKINLEKIINRGIKSESDVNYFMSELGIFLERKNNKTFNIIKFYRDWTQHSQKDSLKEMHVYFEEFDKLLNSVPKIMMLGNNLRKHVEKLTSFIEFRKELKTLLEDSSINTTFVDSEKEWNLFCDNLIQLLIRKPIHFKRLKTTPVRHRLSPAPISRKTITFLIDYGDPKFVPVFIPGAIYWAIFINTSEVPISGVVKFPPDWNPIDKKTGKPIIYIPSRRPPSF